MTTPIFRTRLWSTECAIADAQSGEPPEPHEPAYEFSHGKRRRIATNPYANFPEPLGEGGGHPAPDE
jgi:hypothetical protein